MANGKYVVAGFVGLVSIALVPIAYMPLKSRNVKEEPEAVSGFQKQGMWRSLESQEKK